MTKHFLVHKCGMIWAQLGGSCSWSLTWGKGGRDDSTGGLVHIYLPVVSAAWQLQGSQTHAKWLRLQTTHVTKESQAEAASPSESWLGSPTDHICLVYWLRLSQRPTPGPPLKGRVASTDETRNSVNVIFGKTQPAMYEPTKTREVMGAAGKQRQAGSPLPTSQAIQAAVTEIP